MARQSKVITYLQNNLQPLEDVFFNSESNSPQSESDDLPRILRGIAFVRHVIRALTEKFTHEQNLPQESRSLAPIESIDHIQTLKGQTTMRILMTLMSQPRRRQIILPNYELDGFDAVFTRLNAAIKSGDIQKNYAGKYGLSQWLQKNSTDTNMVRTTLLPMLPHEWHAIVPTWFEEGPKPTPSPSSKRREKFQPIDLEKQVLQNTVQQLTQQILSPSFVASYNTFDGLIRWLVENNLGHIKPADLFSKLSTEFRSTMTKWRSTDISVELAMEIRKKLLEDKFLSKGSHHSQSPIYWLKRNGFETIDIKLFILIIPEQIRSMMKKWPQPK